MDYDHHMLYRGDVNKKYIPLWLPDEDKCKDITYNDVAWFGFDNLMICIMYAIETDYPTIFKIDSINNTKSKLIWKYAWFTSILKGT